MGNTTGTKFQTSAKQSPMKLETNYMNQFGKNSEADVDLRKEYMEKERGLLSYIKFILDSANQQSN